MDELCSVHADSQNHMRYCNESLSVSGALKSKAVCWCFGLLHRVRFLSFRRICQSGASFSTHPRTNEQPLSWRLYESGLQHALFAYLSAVFACE